MADPGATGEKKARRKGRGLSFRIIGTIFKKEMVDAFRDKRTMFIMIFLPMFFMPLVMIGIPALMIEKQAAAAEQTSKVVVIGYEHTLDLEGREQAVADLASKYGIDLDEEYTEEDLREDIGNGNFSQEISMAYYMIDLEHSSWLNILLGNESAHKDSLGSLLSLAELAERNLTENGVGDDSTDVSEDVEDLTDFLDRMISYVQENFTFVYGDIADEDMYLDALHDGEIHSIVIIPENVLEREKEREMHDLTIYYDATNPKSMVALTERLGYVAAYETYLLRWEVLIDEGMETQEITFVLNPVNLEPEDVSTPSEKGGYFLSLMLPMIMGIYVVSGSMYTTIDITAGEKERHTLEALLVTPPTRGNIVLGKFLTILTITLIIVVVAMVSMVLSLNLGGFALSSYEGISFSLTPLMMASVVLIFFILAVMINALEMAICFVAKSFKEAQNYVTPLTFGVLFPAILLQGIAVEDAPNWLFALPIINVLAVFQEVLTGSASGEHMAIVIVSSTIYALVSSYIALKVFEREDILFRT